jgi:hypothetical protein
MHDVEAQLRRRRRRSAASISQWRDLLVPTERLEVICPRGLHHATYQRLVNEYNRVLEKLNALPSRALWPHLRKAYEHQFLNRIVRWYRASDAALFLGVSTKSVLRWTATGFLRCERAGDRAHRYYAHEELLRVQHRLKT